MTDRHELYGCIEAGGTKFVLGLIRGDRAIVARAHLPTDMPGTTIGDAVRWLDDASRDHGRPVAIGIASFGPVSLDRARPDWGHILATTKPGWRGADMAGPFADLFRCPIGFDTDVNGAALAESLWGAGVGSDISAYVTVGTGIGGGVIVDGVPMHGLGHPEMGHVRPPRHDADRSFPGICPFHGDCFEGLASGPAIIARWGASLSCLPVDHPGHAIIAFYLAQLTVALSALIAPRRIVLGGGVMETPGLLERVGAARRVLGGGYFPDEESPVVVAPVLGANAGLFGALALAVKAASHSGTVAR